jgi:hypothetical protein
MVGPMNHPILFLVVLLPLFWFSAWIGTRFRGSHPAAADKMRDYFAMILGAALTLLGLIIAFTFSMAVSRYDQRKTNEEQEANAIGTEYVRASLLPAADAAKVQSVLKEYLDQRIHFYETRNEFDLPRINSSTAQLQAQMWSSVVPSLGTLPPPVAALLLSGMNDVLNSQGYTQAAWWNRIPLAAWALLVLISIFCNFLIGYAAPARNSVYLMILPIALSISLALIADIDSPRHGLIRVQAQNLESLSDSLRSQ